MNVYEYENCSKPETHIWTRWIFDEAKKIKTYPYQYIKVSNLMIMNKDKLGENGKSVDCPTKRKTLASRGRSFTVW